VPRARLILRVLGEQFVSPMSELAVPTPLDRLAAGPSSGSQLPTEDREAQLLWRLRYSVARTRLRQLLTTARLRTALVTGLSLFFWTGLFLLFYEGFTFIVDNVGMAGATYHAPTVRFVFHLFFASLNVMLVFSSGIILYTSLYNSPETQYLLTLPIRSERIVLYKFQEAVFYSSWGFFLLASPIMIAYGIVVGAPWSYYVLLLPLIIAFVSIPCGVGAILCLLVIHRLPKLRKIVVFSAAFAVLTIAGPLIWRTISSPQSRLFGSEWFQETLHRFRFTQQEWLPSTWLTNGLLEAARIRAVGITSNVTDLPVVQSTLYLALLISNALFLHVLTVWAAKRLFRVSFSNFATRRTRRRPVRMAWSDRIAQTLLFGFPKPLQLLIIKDWQLLRRDPVQWSQFLIFFGLLGLYFLNVDRFNNPHSDIGYVTWINMVSFLNLAVVGLILSTFTTRFIYPMISLEGHCFWILGLLPVERDTILWSKFWFASLGSWVPCALLVLLSDMMLQVPTLVICVHQLTCVLLCLGLASIAVGFGAMMPNFHETSPSKIAAGFGGTLNLVLSALYIMVVVVLTALPCHFYLLAGKGPWGSEFFSPQYLKMWLIVGTGAAIIVGAIATVVPLQRGLRAFRQLEFI
jgi:ABC-2 type transport system permease protein